MFNPIQFYEFGKSRGGIPNTFIGGVSATIGTAQLLATKLAIDVSRITAFLILGADIQCKISGNYVIPINCFYYDNTITYYHDLGGLVTDIGNSAFRDDLNSRMKITSLIFNGIINLTPTTTIILGSPITEIFLANCVSISNSVFNSQSPAIYKRYIYIPKCTALGSTALNNNVFANSLLSGSVIVCHPSLATNNAGGVDGDIQNAISQGAAIRYKTNETAPNAVNDLSSGAIHNTNIQLNFTPPTSINLIDYYECYADGVLKNKISASGEYITGLKSSTSYNITVVSVDVFYNKSVVSNSHFTTTNTTFFISSSKVIAAYGLSNGIDAKNGYNATVGADISFSAGVNGNAANFNAAANSVITIPDNNVFTFNDGVNDKPFSIKFDLKLNNLTDQWLVNKRGGTATTDEWQIIYYQNKLQFGLHSANGASLLVDAPALTVGITNTLIFTYNGNKFAHGLKIYINGVSQYLGWTGNSGTYNGMSNGTAPVIIGRAGFNSSFARLNGQIDEMYIFNTELTQDEVDALKTIFYPF